MGGSQKFEKNINIINICGIFYILKINLRGKNKIQVVRFAHNMFDYVQYSKAEKKRNREGSTYFYVFNKQWHERKIQDKRLPNSTFFSHKNLLHSSILDEKPLDIYFHNILQVRHKQNCLNTMLIIPRYQDECVILVKNVKHL